MGHRYKEDLPQGSWAHKTIISPVTACDEFDADILLHLENNPDWNDNPKIYLQADPRGVQTQQHLQGQTGP